MSGASTSRSTRSPWALTCLPVWNARTTNTVPSTRVGMMIAESVTATRGGLSMMTRSNRSPSSCAMNLRKRSDCSKVRRIGRQRPGGDRTRGSARSSASRPPSSDRRVAYQRARQTGIARAIEKIRWKPRADVDRRRLMHDPLATPEPSARSRCAARHGRLSFGRSGAGHEEPPAGLIRVHEHQVGADAPRRLGHPARRAHVYDELGRPVDRRSRRAAGLLLFRRSRPRGLVERSR